VSAERATLAIEPLGRAARSTYKSIVYETLYELIQELVLPPGERLVEADLAARFGVSKTPIREALLLLAEQGLVALVPHAGATVTGLSLEDYEQLLFLQDALEQPALPLVVERITAAELQAGTALMDEIRAAYDERDLRLYHHLVVRMHGELFAAARYPRLTQLIDTIMHPLCRYHPIFVRPDEENLEREVTIVIERFAHVRAGDAAGAAEAVQRGHAAMFAFARRLVEARDPHVMRYLSVRRDRPQPAAIARSAIGSA
jgi:DNA-binding GntR family transcriptional regulator